MSTYMSSERYDEQKQREEESTQKNQNECLSMGADMVCFLIRRRTGYIRDGILEKNLHGNPTE